MYDVVISGAGPAGVTAAVHLAQAGVRVALLEAGEDVAKDLRASTFHPPTLDYLRELGLSEALHAQGIRSPEYRYINRRTGQYVSFDLTELSDVTDHPYRLQCEQWKLTILASQRLRAMPSASLYFSHRVTGFTQDADSVTALAETPGGPAAVTGRYLLSCDGAASAIRKATGVEFDGFTWEEKFLTLSTLAPLETRLDICNVNYMADPADWMVVLRAPTAWRVLVPGKEHDADADLLSDAKARAVFANLLRADDPIETTHRTIYRVHQRVARRYRFGRVLLAGDAAHLNNPLGGFGMNAALHDARNFCTQVIAILNGAPEDRLDLYERQRRAVMQEFIQAQSIRNKRFIEMSPEQATDEGEQELRATAADPARRRAYLLRQSMYAAVAREQEIG
jgi:3-(3-hydroxy-phenyl)propionate hydroxylase